MNENQYSSQGEQFHLENETSVQQNFSKRPGTTQHKAPQFPLKTELQQIPQQ